MNQPRPRRRFVHSRPRHRPVYERSEKYECAEPNPSVPPRYPLRLANFYSLFPRDPLKPANVSPFRRKEGTRTPWLFYRVSARRSRWCHHCWCRQKCDSPTTWKSDRLSSNQPSSSNCRWTYSTYFSRRPVVVGERPSCYHTWSPVTEQFHGNPGS